MKKVNSLLLTAFATLAITQARSQGPKLPAASPAASVKQTFGLTDITIDYSSPAVKGRTIWGGLIPYDSVWRTGANAATVINFSTSVSINGTNVKAGKYALFTIPGRDMWTIIINSDYDQWGSFGYNKGSDVLRVKVKPEMTSESKERMAFYLDPTSDSTCNVTLRWEKVKVTFEVKANTLMMLQKGFDNMGSTYASAANYYVDNKLDLNKAEEWTKMALDMNKNSFYFNYVMAKVMQAKGDNKEALKYAEESKKLGEAANDNFYHEFKSRIDKLLAELNTGSKK
jgi:hypothetical protein